MSEDEFEEYYIDDEEVYPIWILVEPREELCDYFKRTRKKVKIPKEKLKELNEANEKYKEMQEYLESLLGDEDE